MKVDSLAPGKRPKPPPDAGTVVDGADAAKGAPGTGQRLPGRTLVVRQTTMAAGKTRVWEMDDVRFKHCYMDLDILTNVAITVGGIGDTVRAHRLA